MSKQAGRNALAVLLAVFCWLSAGPVTATAIELITSNDVLAGNRFEDDLYTASVTLDLHLQDHLLSVRQALFTDRKAGTRFDETWVMVRPTVRHVGRWESQLGYGVVHVGRGLLGENAQNAVHRLIGDARVHLRYAGPSRLVPCARFDLTRVTPVHPRIYLIPNVEAVAAPGFKSHAKAGIRGSLLIRKNLSIHPEIGLRLSHSDYEQLDPHTRSVGGAHGVTLGIYKKVYVSWTQNNYGTGSRHLHVFTTIGGHE